MEFACTNIVKEVKGESEGGGSSISIKPSLLVDRSIAKPRRMVGHLKWEERDVCETASDIDCSFSPLSLNKSMKFLSIVCVLLQSFAIALPLNEGVEGRSEVEIAGRGEGVFG